MLTRVNSVPKFSADPAGVPGADWFRVSEAAQLNAEVQQRARIIKEMIFLILLPPYFAVYRDRISIKI